MDKTSVRLLAVSRTVIWDGFSLSISTLKLLWIMIKGAVPLRARELLSPTSVCLRCYLRLSRPAPRHASRTFASATTPSQAKARPLSPGAAFKREYFLANGYIGRPPWGAERDYQDRRGNVAHTSTFSPSLPGDNSSALKQNGAAAKTSLLSSTAAASPIPAEILPHRRRQRQSQPPASAEPSASDDAQSLPPDAPSRLTTLSSTLPAHSLRRLLTTYLSLSKPRLTFLIVLTTTSAYGLFPVPTVLLPSITASPSLSTLTLAFLTTGTALTSACANTLNMLFEPAHDAKMTRTRNRPLVRNLISPLGAACFALATGTAGLALLALGTNPTVTALAALNILLYAGVYTPLKRLSVLNTWAGALVGAIPPLMGWAAAAGQTAPTGHDDWRSLLFSSPESAGGWLLAALLFAWQFPHFNALSWPLRFEYRDAGYRMLAWVNPRRNARVALRYAILLFPICAGLVAVRVVDPLFLVDSSLVNAWMVRAAWRFWKYEGARGSARGLFWASVWHLPVVMVLALVHKEGLWRGVWERVVGGEEEGEDDDDDEEGELGLETDEEEGAEKRRLVGQLVKPG